MTDGLRHAAGGLALLALATAPLPGADAPPPWDAAAQTLVVFNPDYPGSAALAAYYAEKRRLPSDRLLPLPCSVSDDLTRAEFDATLRQPLRQHFEKNRLWSRVRVLVLMRGIPFRVKRALDPKEVGREDEAAVDSELTLLSQAQPELPGHIENAYFKSRERFNHFANPQRLLLTGRLDGPDDATVRRMIDDAVTAEQTGLLGRSVIDLALRTGPFEMGEEWLRQTARSHRRAGIPTYADRRPEVIPAGWPLPDTILYHGWYRDQASGALADLGFRFVPGALAIHLHSFSAAHLRDVKTSWAAHLLQRGAAATLGNVWEPYLPLTCHLHHFNERLLEGFTLAEAAAAATPALSWMQVVLGDPLYRPFAKPANRRAPAGVGEEYVFYRGLVTRQAPDADPDVLKKQLLRLAEEKGSARLLELLALHSWSLGEGGEAAALFEHAAALATDPAERTRLERYWEEAGGVTSDK